jgi:hypothetical protein
MSVGSPKSRKDLRRFGLALGIALSVVGGLLLWRERAAGPYLLAAAVLLWLLAALVPEALRPLEWLLGKVARAITTALTYVVLTVSFFLVVTPIGLLLRLLGKDPLGLKPAPDQASFWVSVGPEAPSTRPDKPY